MITQVHQRREHVVSESGRLDGPGDGDRRPKPRQSIFQLDDDALGRLLADAGNRGEPGHVGLLDGAYELVRLHAGQHRQREPRADAADTNQSFEKRELERRRESVQGQGILTDMSVNTQRDVAAFVTQAVKGRERNRHVIADAVDVDHNAVRLLLGDPPAQVGNHVRAGRYRRQLVPLPAPSALAARTTVAASGGVWQCTRQMATASASAASCGDGTAASPRSSLTICWTCGLSARPYPTTARLISAGVYSTTGSPACAAASIATPRAWPSFSAVRTFAA